MEEQDGITGQRAITPDSAALAWLTSPPRRSSFLTTFKGRLATGLLLVGLVGALLSFWWLGADSEGLTVPIRDGYVEEGPPLVTAPFAPAALRTLTRQDAQKWNETVPQIDGVSAPARAFLADLANGTMLTRSLDCLTAAIYYEAGNEPVEGQRAVAQVVLNRVRHPAYPNSICGVVYQGAQRETGCQFTFACDGSLARKPMAGGWARSRSIAAAALGGYVYPAVGWATHYHADYVVPYWAAKLIKIDTVGAHIFYRWAGAWGEQAAFKAAYSGIEPLPVWQSLGEGDDAVDKAGASGVAEPRPRAVLANLPEEPDSIEQQGSGVTANAGQATSAPRAAPTGERWVIAGRASRPSTTQFPTGSVIAPPTKQALPVPPIVQP